MVFEISGAAVQDAARKAGVDMGEDWYEDASGMFEQMHGPDCFGFTGKMETLGRFFHELGLQTEYAGDGNPWVTEGDGAALASLLMVGRMGLDRFIYGFDAKLKEN